MPVRLLPVLELHTYMTDGRRLLYVLSLSRGEALVEDALSGGEEILSLQELSRPRWRQVIQRNPEVS